MRIITVNLPLSYIRAIKSLTGKNGLFPSRSELIRVATREWLIKELESAKSFVKFQKQLENTPFSAEYPKTEPVEEEEEEEEKIEEKFEIDIDDILGIEKKEEPMSSEIKYKTEFQRNFQRVPTYIPPAEKTGRIVDLGNRIRIDGKVFNLNRGDKI